MRTLKESLISRVKNAGSLDSIRQDIDSGIADYLNNSGVLNEVVTFTLRERGSTNIYRPTTRKPGESDPKVFNNVFFSAEKNAVVVECKVYSTNNTSGRSIFDKFIYTTIRTDLFDKYNIPKKIIFTGNSKKLEANNIKIGKPVVVRLVKNDRFLNNGNGIIIEGFEFITGFENAKGTDLPNIAITTTEGTNFDDVRGINKFKSCKFTGNFSFYNIGTGPIKGYGRLEYPTAFARGVKMVTYSMSFPDRKFRLVVNKDGMGYGKMDNPGDYIKFDLKDIFAGSSKSSGSKLFINMGVIKDSDLETFLKDTADRNEFITVNRSLINGVIFNISPKNSEPEWSDPYNPKLVEL